MGLLSGGVRAIARAGRAGGARRMRDWALAKGKAGDMAKAWALYTALTAGAGGAGFGTYGYYRERGEPYGDPMEGAARGAAFGAATGPFVTGPMLGASAGLGPLGAAPLVPWTLTADNVIDGPRKRRQRLAEQQAFEQALRDYEMEQRMYGPNLVHGAGQPR